MFLVLLFNHLDLIPTIAYNFIEIRQMIISFMGLSLMVFIYEKNRHNNREKLRKSHEILETKVKERTNELSMANDILKEQIEENMRWMA